MSRTVRASPIPKFLGLAADADAFDVLGITPDQCTPARVEASLQRQLDRVAAHAEGDTPEADEVRLALHAAAAQVLDATVRRQLTDKREQRPAEPEPSEAQATNASVSVENAAPKVGARYTPPPDSNAPVRQLVLIAGVGGGLAVVAIVLGVIFLVPDSSKAPPAAPSIPVSATSGSGPVAGAATTTSPAVAAGSEPGADAASRDATATTQVQAPAKSGRSEFVEGTQVVRQLRAASTKARTDGAAGLVEFRAAIKPLSDWWAKYDVGQRRAADDAVLEFLYVVGEKTDLAGEVVRELTALAVLPGVESGPLAADRVWPAAWATGVLCRLGEERGLPRPVAAQIAQALNDTLGAGRAEGEASFEAGVEAALRRMPTRLVAPLNPAMKPESIEPRSAEGVRRWVDAVLVVAANAAEQERILVDGLEQVLVDGPSAEEDRAAFEAIEKLVTSIKWRAGGVARERLLDWFNDPRVSAGDMRVVTGALAAKSGAEGVDATMQLSVTASPDDRAVLRARYATAWGLAKVEAKGQALEEWRAKAMALDLAIMPDAKDDDLARVARLVVAVRTNHAARRLWLGDAPGCLRIVSDLDRLPATIRDIGTTPSTPPPSPVGPTAPAPSPMTPRPRGTSPLGIAPPPAPPAPPEPFSQGSGSWAEAYLRAERNIPMRLHRLTEAESLTLPLARGDAAVLVEAALFASPASVRQAAQRVVGRFGDDPSIVEQCLDQLPLAPRVQSVSDMFAKVSRGTLPKVGDPEWELAARRALVERALGLVAGQGPQAGIDQACALIAESYLAMAGAESGSSPDESAADRCVRGAGQLFRLWRLEADRLPPPEHAPVSLDQIERRRRSRQQIASGPIQAFAGEQVSVAELFAYVVCAERPVQASRATTIIEDMARERRGADHVFEQMRATERAIARLWSLRLGEGAQ